jgi:hypothetical protein
MRTGVLTYNMDWAATNYMSSQMIIITLEQQTAKSVLIRFLLVTKGSERQKVSN